MKDALKRMLEIKKRKAELRASINTLSGDELDKAVDEVQKLADEEADLEKRMKEADEVEKRGKAVITPAGVKIEVEEKNYTPESEEYRTAFLKNLQGKKLNDEEKRALTTATDSVGSVIPTITMNRIIEKIEQAGVIYPHVSTLAIPSKVKMPIEGETAEFSWVDEGAESTDSKDTMSELELGSMELIKTLDITAHVEAMSIDAFESFIVALLARKARKAIDYAIVNGDGKKQALGILKSVTASETVGTAWTYDDIIDLKRGLKSGYYQNAKFIMSSTTLGMVEKIKDDNGRPIFKEESDKNVPLLSNKPVLVYDNIPDGTILFGDLEYYFFNFVKAFEIAKDTSVGFKSGKTCYRAMALCDGKLALAETFNAKTKKAGE